jgi:hypothetical protein
MLSLRIITKDVAELNGLITLQVISIHSTILCHISISVTPHVLELAHVSLISCLLVLGLIRPCNEREFYVFSTDLDWLKQILMNCLCVGYEMCHRYQNVEIVYDQRKYICVVDLICHLLPAYEMYFSHLRYQRVVSNSM